MGIRANFAGGLAPPKIGTRTFYNRDFSAERCPELGPIRCIMSTIEHRAGKRRKQQIGAFWAHLISVC